MFEEKDIGTGHNIRLCYRRFVIKKLFYPLRVKYESIKSFDLTCVFF